MGLIEKIRDGRAKAGVVGLGYVGLPLAVEIAESGLEVVGIDVQPKKVDAINAGRSYILDVPSERVAALVREKRLSATSDYARVAELDTINIAARNRLAVTLQPSAHPNRRPPFRTTTAPITVATMTERPSRLSRLRLRFRPMEKTRKTSPTCAKVCTRSASATSANGGVFGPMIAPATR